MRATTSHRRGFPCFDDLLFQACRRHYPDGTAGCCRCLAQRHRPSPKLSRVGFRHMSFRGLLGVHSRFGLPVRSITQGDLYQSTSTHVVTSLRRSGCFRPSDRLAGWDSHPLEIADLHGVLSKRHNPNCNRKARSLAQRQATLQSAMSSTGNRQHESWQSKGQQHDRRWLWHCGQ